MDEGLSRNACGFLLWAAVAALICGAGFARAQADAMPATAAQPPQEQFPILEFRVLGAQVLPAIDIERAVYPFLGEGRTVATVEQARVALEKAYRDTGYGTVFVDIPEQDVEEGIVRLKVTEGRLDRVLVSGARYFSNGRIRAAVPALRPDSIMKLPELEAQLAVLNRQTRDRQVTPVLRAGRTPGTVDAELKVKDALPLHASVELNNRYTADTSETRLSTTLSYDNLFQRYHSLSFQYQTAPSEPSDARVLAATYVAPFGGKTLAAYVVDTDSEFATLGADFAELGVIGKGRIYGLRYIIALPERTGFYHNLSLGADYKDFREVIVQDDGALAETPISYINWSVAWSGTLRSEHTLTGLEAAINFGIRGLANSAEEFHFKRYAGQPNKGLPDYFYLRASAGHERPLLAGWSLFGRLSGQYSPEPLISNEQFSTGGAETVRGYLESEYLGDVGANATLELRTPPLSRWWSALQTLYFFAFYDGGVVGINEPLAIDGVINSRYELSSWGLGMRLAGFRGLAASLDWAYPRIDSNHVEAGDSRLHFSVRYMF